MLVELVYDDEWVAPAVDDAVFESVVDGSWDADPLPPFDECGAMRGPVDRVVADLGAADRAMSRVLRGMAEAGPRDGLTARRLVGLLAGVTGVDIGFSDRAVQVLDPMPRTRAAFDAGQLSWSQVRGIVIEARRFSSAQREQLDQALAGTIAQARDRGEPDRVVEVAGDIAARLDEAGQERLEAAQERAQRLVLQPGFDGWGEIHGTRGPEVFASTAAALDALADATVAADAPPPTDDDGNVLPAAARPQTSRTAQLAEGLGRMAALVLGGTDGSGGGSRRARPRVTVIAALSDLLAADDHRRDTGRTASTGDAVRGGPIYLRMADLTSRLLLRRGNGRRRLSRALTRTLADDADLVPLFVDDDGMPVAIGDSFSLITPAMRRAVAARDQGCRAPGCSAAADHCDVHHVIPREEDGPTEIGNLVLMCRACHTRITAHRWHMQLHPDATLHTRIGRRTFITRSRLPGLTDQDRRPGRPDQPVRS